MGREIKGERVLLSSECVQSQNNGGLITITRRKKDGVVDSKVVDQEGKRRACRPRSECRCRGRKEE
jgi:hypothetical protein